MTQPPTTDRIWTVPNAISAARLLMVAAFAYLIWTKHDLAALGMLVICGLSDWVDGVIARRFNQFSRLGALLDPAADRVLIVVTVVGLAWREIIPWWLLAALLAREIMMGLTLLLRRRAGHGPPPVEFVGKAATMALMYGFPLLLLASLGGWIGQAAWVTGWAFSIWGLAFYWVAGVIYVQQTYQLLTARATSQPSPAGEGRL